MPALIEIVVATPAPVVEMGDDVIVVSAPDANVSVALVVVRAVKVKLVKVAIPPTAALPDAASPPPSVPAEAVTLTVAVELVKLPYASRIRTSGWVGSTEPEAPATGWAPIANLFATAALTVTVSRSEPVEEIDPSVTETTGTPAANNAIEPVATPLVNVNDVAEPNAVPATVGAVTGLVDEAAPENVKDFPPVNDVAVFPFTS